MATELSLITPEATHSNAFSGKDYGKYYADIRRYYRLYMAQWHNVGASQLQGAQGDLSLSQSLGCCLWGALYCLSVWLYSALCSVFYTRSVVTNPGILLPCANTPDSWKLGHIALNWDRNMFIAAWVPFLLLSFLHIPDRFFYYD